MYFIYFLLFPSTFFFFFVKWNYTSLSLLFKVDKFFNILREVNLLVVVCTCLCLKKQNIKEWWKYLLSFEWQELYPSIVMCILTGFSWSDTTVCHRCSNLLWPVCKQVSILIVDMCAGFSRIRSYSREKLNNSGQQLIKHRTVATGTE